MGDGFDRAAGRAYRKWRSARCFRCQVFDLGLDFKEKPRLPQRTGLELDRVRHSKSPVSPSPQPTALNLVPMARRGRASFAKTRTPPESDQMGGIFVNASPGPYIAPTACLRPEKRICAARILTGNVLRLSAIFGGCELVLDIARWRKRRRDLGGGKFERGWNLAAARG